MTIEYKYKSAAFISLVLSVGIHTMLILFFLFFKLNIKNKAETSTHFTEVLTEESIIQNSSKIYSAVKNIPEGISEAAEPGSGKEEGPAGTRQVIKTASENPGGSGSIAADSKTIIPGSNIATADKGEDGINIARGAGKGLGTGSGGGTGIGTYGTGNAGGGGLPKLPFVPRQVMEVLPKNIESAEGEISVHIRINTNGTVNEYKIIRNTTTHPECLNAVVKALNKSRWEAVSYNGGKIEYWVEKNYIFGR